jgi:hypothetical protein
VDDEKSNDEKPDSDKYLNTPILGFSFHLARGGEGNDEYISQYRLDWVKATMAAAVVSVASNQAGGLMIATTTAPAPRAVPTAPGRTIVRGVTGRVGSTWSVPGRAVVGQANITSTGRIEFYRSDRRQLALDDFVTVATARKEAQPPEKAGSMGKYSKAIQSSPIRRICICDISMGDQRTVGPG